MTLAPELEQQIQRVVDSGAFCEPAELLSHALDLIEAEQHTGDWLFANSEAINVAPDESSAQAERGEGHSPEQSRALLAGHLAARNSRAAYPFAFCLRHRQISNAIDSGNVAGDGV